MWKKSRKGSFNYMLQSRRHFTSQLAELLLCILSKMKMTEESRGKKTSVASILVLWCKEQLDLIYCIVFASSDSWSLSCNIQEETLRSLNHIRMNYKLISWSHSHGS